MDTRLSIIHWKGLPTSNIESIRLLAHSFLFELDEFFKKKSNECYTRWMDDIVIGADDEVKATEIISATSDFLKSRGLALNLAKTHIYNSSKARCQFLIDINIWIDEFESKIEKKLTQPQIKTLENELKNEFKKHLKDTQPKYWDKISKRFITQFIRLKSKKLLSEVKKLYLNTPAIRPNLIYYLSDFGYSSKTRKIVSEILDELKIFDDITLFKICHLLTNWNIGTDAASLTYIKEIHKKLMFFTFSRKSPFDFYCILCFINNNIKFSFV